MIKLLVVDQHPVICKGLELVFDASLDIEVVGSVGDGDAIFNFIRNEPVDVILTEIDLPKLNGITALRRLKKDYPEIKVIMFSAYPEEIYAVSSIKAGAVGYINKTSDLITLKEAIIKVNKGGIYLSNALAQSLAFGSKSTRNDTHYKKLSTREVEVLQLLSTGRRNKEIAHELDINEKTVSTYRARLMRKLNVTNLVDLVNQASQLEL